MSKKYAITLLSKNKYNVYHNYIYLNCLVDNVKQIKRMFDFEYHIIDIYLIEGKV